MHVITLGKHPAQRSIALGQNRAVAGQPHRLALVKQHFDFERAATIDTQADLPGEAEG
jgi:hypothetical protein